MMIGDPDIFNLLDITPNEYVILWCIFQERSLPEWNTVTPELRKLKAQEWLNPEGKLTQKSIELIEKFTNDSTKVQSIAKYKDRIKEYNELFPNIMFPSGVAARAPMSALTPRFKWFFSNHEYDWDVIIEVTKKYLEDKQYVAWDKAICAKYFVKKRKNDGIDDSILAELCNLYVNGETNHQLKIFRDNTF